MKNQSLTIRIDSDKYDRLTELAASMERSKSFLVDDAITNYLTVNEWFIAMFCKIIITQPFR